MRVTYDTKEHLHTHAACTSSLLDCICQMQFNDDPTVNAFIPDLIGIARDRAEQMMEMLETGEVHHDQ